MRQIPNIHIFSQCIPKYVKYTGLYIKSKQAFDWQGGKQIFGARGLLHGVSACRLLYNLQTIKKMLRWLRRSDAVSCLSILKRNP